MTKVKPYMGPILAVSIVAGGAFLVWHYLLPIAKEKSEYIPLATFVVLAITLAALIYYVYDTNRIANATEEKWEFESRPRGVYSLHMAANSKQPYGDEVEFQLYNLSKDPVKAKVWCNFCIYDEPVKGLGQSFDGFNGVRSWPIFPQEMVRSSFNITPILSAKERSFQDMQSRRDEDNRTRQLTVDLEIEFRNERGDHYRLPSRRYFFDFKLWEWVPWATTEDSNEW